MNASVGIVVCVFLLNYLLHSTLAVALTHVIAYRLRWVRHPELRALFWKLTLTLPIVSALAMTTSDWPHFGMQLSLLPETEAMSFGEESNQLRATASLGKISSTSEMQHFRGAQTTSQVSKLERRDHGVAYINPPSGDLRSSAASGSLSRSAAVCLFIAFLWFGIVVVGCIKLGKQLRQLQRLRLNASRMVSPEMDSILNRLRGRFCIRREIALLKSPHIEGPLTAGIFRPFVMLPAHLSWDNAAEREAILAHELVHVARWDALWNLAIQVICRAFPIQPLNGFAGRQFRKEMDFVADSLAAQTSGIRVELVQCLLRLSNHHVEAASVTKGNSPLAACMASFDSMLGQRIEALLTETNLPCPSSRLYRSAVVAIVFAGAALAASIAPRAVVRTSHPFTASDSLIHSSKLPMKKSISTLAILAGLTMPAVADEPGTPTETRSAAKVQATLLKSTPDPIPKGILRFNGMLVGRLAAKDVEKGTFLVQVDAVPRVWQNSTAEDPRSIVGKTVEITGVFGKFLDVLVVTRVGETIEFECKHDGERLVFPGELLRKVAAYDPSDYPVLPEEFRGFQGAVTASVIKKDPETFELIVKVDRVTETWQDNKAKDAKAIEGKPLMLAGFWNRKDAYHDMKVGDRIHVGMKHIGMRSDHLTVAESVRNAEEDVEPEMMKKDVDANVEDGFTKELRGFRGMLVGRLVAKDVERGTFSIAVDAVPRVWNNNRASNPKSFLGTNVGAEGVTGKMLDALVVAKLGDTVEFGALHDGGDRMRVGEVLRKVAPVKPGDYPVLPNGFRGFKGIVIAKVVRKDDQMLDMVVEITGIKTTFPASKARHAETIIGQPAMLAGFWQRKEAFNNIAVGDLIECGVEHPQYLSDHLSVIESVKKIEKK